MTWRRSFGSNKYGAKKTVTGGIKFDSKFEAGYAQQLALRLLAKEIISWEAHVALRLYCYGRHICDYKVDFKVTVAPKCFALVETKGLVLGDFRTRWKLLEANLDQKDFREANGFSMDDEITMELVQQSKRRPFRKR